MLGKLPSEVLEGVASQVGNADLGALRLTSRTIRDKLIHHCGVRLFRKVLTDLSRDSLEHISRIARNDDIARFILTMEIRGLGVRYIDAGPSCTSELGEGYQWPRDKSGCLDAPCPGLDRLRTLLEQQLVKCRAIQIGRSVQHPPLYLKRLNPTDCLQLILLLISKYGINISMLDPHEQNFTRDYHRLPCTTICQPLRVGGAEAWNAMESFKFVYSSGWPHGFGWLNNLFGLMTGLRELCFSPMERVHTTGAIDSMLSLSSPVLTKLIIGTIGIDEGKLFKVLRKWTGTLRHFEMCDMILYDHKDAWLKLLRRLPSVLPGLRYFVINHVWFYDGHTMSNLYFQQASDYADGTVAPGVSASDAVFGSQFLRVLYQHPENPLLKLAIRAEKNEGKMFVSGFECDGDHVGEGIKFMTRYAKEVEG